MDDPILSVGSTTTIEDVQDKLDKFALALFEGARGHIDATSYPEKSQAITDAYKESVETVNRLVGIEKTKAQQVSATRLRGIYDVTYLNILSSFSFQRRPSCCNYLSNTTSFVKLFWNWRGG
jgi:hypothetical protein